MSLIVDVKPVSYMMLNVREAFTPNKEGTTMMTKLPKGFDLPMDASYHDETGKEEKQLVRGHRREREHNIYIERGLERGR